MQSLEERVAYLEGQVSGQSHSVLELRETVRDLERCMDARFDSVDRRLDAMGGRIDALNVELSHRIQSVDDDLSRRLDTLDEKVSRQFVWLVGVQVTTLVAIVGALLAKG